MEHHGASSSIPVSLAQLRPAHASALLPVTTRSQDSWGIVLSVWGLLGSQQGGACCVVIASRALWASTGKGMDSKLL